MLFLFCFLFAVIFNIMATQEKNPNESIEDIKSSLRKFKGLHKKEEIFSGDNAGV